MTTSLSVRGSRLSLAGVGAALGAVGLVLIVVGTFLPWLRSGRVLRNSYETDGAIKRLLAPDGIAHAALVLWPVVSLACTASLALYLLRARGAAIALAVLTSVIAVAVGLGALSAPELGTVSVVVTGPAVTVSGSILTLFAATLRFVIFVRDDRRNR